MSIVLPLGLSLSKPGSRREASFDRLRTNGMEPGK